MAEPNRPLVIVGALAALMLVVGIGYAVSSAGGPEPRSGGPINSGGANDEQDGGSEEAVATDSADRSDDAGVVLIDDPSEVAAMFDALADDRLAELREDLASARAAGQQNQVQNLEARIARIEERREAAAGSLRVNPP